MPSLCLKAKSKNFLGEVRYETDFLGLEYIKRLGSGWALMISDSGLHEGIVYGQNTAISG
jgi:hypothetical protein